MIRFDSVWFALVRVNVLLFYALVRYGSILVWFVWFDVVRFNLIEFNGCVWLGNDLIRSVSMCFDLIHVYLRVFDSFWFGVIRCDPIQYVVVCFDLMLRGLGWFNFICLDPSFFDAGRFGSIQVFVVLFDLICLDLVRFHSVDFLWTHAMYVCFHNSYRFLIVSPSRTERWVSSSSCDSWSFIDMVSCGVRVSYSEDSSQTH